MRRVADVALWVGAVLGVLSVVAAVLVATLGLVPLIFTSGSMSPGIPAGSLGVARSVPAADLELGDVVSVDTSDGVRVTHRVVAIEGTADGALLTLQGDANGAPDADLYPVTEADRVLFSVPGVGRVLSALGSPVAIFGAGVLAAVVLLGVVYSSSRRSRGRRRATTSDDASGTGGAGRRRRPGRVAASVLVAALPAVLALQPALPTAAAFSDLGGTVTTSGFVSHLVLQPTGVSCSGTGTITVTTPASDQRYTYWAQAFTLAGAAVSNAKQLTGTGANRQATFTAPTDFTTTLTAGTSYQLRIYSRVGSTTWQSADYRVQPFVATTAATLSCGAAPIPPTVNFIAPTNTWSGTAAQLRTLISTACAATIAACGTATDNGTIVSVQYILQRSGLLGATCWDGSSWVVSCSYRTATYTPATQRWTIAGNAHAGALAASYTLTIRATDNDGLVTVQTITYSTFL